MGGRVLNEEENGAGEDDYVIRLKDGSNYGECISALQKFIRRGLEEEALVIAHGLYDSGYGMGLARRLPIVASEDVGLANPAAVAQCCVLCSTWIAIRKETKHQPDGLPLMMGVMLLCRSEKSREVDNACVVVQHLSKTGEKRPKDLIEKWGSLVVDSHTAAGKRKIRNEAAEQGISYEAAAWADFLKHGAIVSPLKQINGDPWGRRAYALFGFDYAELNGLTESETHPGKTDRRENT